AEERPARRHLLRGEERDVHPELLLELDALLEVFQVLGRDGEKEIPDLMELGVLAEGLLEPLVERDRVERELDVDLGGELGADPSGGAARVAASQELALEDDRLEAAERQVVGQARPDHASTDDERVGALGHRAYAPSSAGSPTNGLVRISRPMVVSGPCPGNTRVEGGWRKRTSRIVRTRVAQSPPGRSVLP